MNNIIIIGTGGHAKSVIDACEKQGLYNIIGLIDDYVPEGKELMRYKVLTNVEGIKHLYELNDMYSIEGMFIAVGDNYGRSRIYEKVHYFEHVTIIHPSAIIGREVVIGRGVVIMGGAVINSGTSVKEFSIVNTKASLDHDNYLATFASVAPNVTTGGNVVINSYAAIGIGATISNGVHIGDHTVIGAGSVVLKNVVGYKVAYGNPCREIRDRNKTDKYL